jgi:hypothetical protein
MLTEQDARRSTSALLYDESEEEKQAILNQQPLLGYSDIDESGEHKSCYNRIKTRYGLFRRE